MEILVESDNFACDDVLEFSTQFPGWEYEILQISGGRFGFRQSSIRLPGLTLACNSHSRHFEMMETYEPPVVCFCFLLSADRPLRSEGVELTKPYLILQRPEEEHAFVFGGPTKVLHVQVSLDILNRLGWQLEPHRHYVLNRRNLNTFYSWCLSVQDLSGKRISLAQLLRIRNQTLHNLGCLLRSDGALEAYMATRQNHHPSSAIIVSRARAILRSLPHDEPLNVPDIAADLGLSERKLYREFKHWVGIGPARYFELMRLHALRGFLKDPDGKYSSMSAAAQKFGFSNPGRMALRYNELFFEPPGETARRTRKLAS